MRRAIACSKSRRHGLAVAVIGLRLLTPLGLCLSPLAAAAQTVEQLQSLSLEQLANIDVTSVLRRPQPLSDAPAAVYVISADDIRRSGYVSLADVLRLAPNLIVAQRDAQTFAISARGFNSNVDANKLLVMVDGRTIYSPLHSETFWDQLQVPLDDIERIEVVSGPGGTQWGANAVNGVIDIITKNAAATQGGLLDLKAGTVEQNGLLQYGGKFGASGFYRVYGQGMEFGPSVLPGGGSAGDEWHNAQAGFRTDWQRGADTVMLEGDFYRNNDALENGRQYGGNILGRWQHHLANGSDLQVQMSYDEEHRYVVGASDYYATWDLQAQQTLTLGRNVLVWGGELQALHDRLEETMSTARLVPASQTLGVGDAFVQDTVALTDAVKLTVGTKLQYSSYTRFDYLPSIRLGWKVTAHDFLWAAVSRAVRTPSRIDRALTVPGLLALAPEFQTEKLLAYELGYRTQPTPRTSLSISVYWNQYDDLRTLDFRPGNPVPYQLGNAEQGHTYGIEAWGDWRVLRWWKLSAGVALLHKDLHFRSGVIATDAAAGDDPGYQFSLRSSMDLAHNVKFDCGIQVVERLPDPVVENYVQADARIAWQVTPALELSLAGSNLLAAYHVESISAGVAPREVQRNVYLGLRWTY